MWIGLLLLYILIPASTEKLTNFIRYTESTEKFDSMNIFTLSNGSSNIKILEDFLDIPIPKTMLSKPVRPLKLFLNSKVITAVFADEYDSFSVVFESLRYNENSKIVIVSSTMDAEKVLQTFSKKGFINSIVVDPIDGNS